MLICPKCRYPWAAGHPCVLEAPYAPPGGKSGAGWYYVLFVGKTNEERYPWTVVNDRVASQVGRLLGLPVPDTVLYQVGERWVFFSHYVGEPPQGMGDTPPPSHGRDLEAVLLADASESLRHGTVLFDLLVANNDRKADNVVLGVDGRIWLIDHANALFYRPYTWQGVDCPAGPERLAAVAEDPHRMFDEEHHGVDWVTRWECVDVWCQRIAGLQEWQLRPIVEELPTELMTNPEKEALVGFLLHRQRAMREIVEELCGDVFPYLPQRT